MSVSKKYVLLRHTNNLKTKKMRPQLTIEEQKRVKKIINSLPKQLLEIGLTCEAAIDRLLEKGYNFKDAENMAVETLKESIPYIQKGMIKETIKSIKKNIRFIKLRLWNILLSN